LQLTDGSADVVERGRTREQSVGRGRVEELSLPQIPSRRQQSRAGTGCTFRREPGTISSPDWRGVSCRLIAVRNSGTPRGKNVAEGYFASLGGAPLVPVMKSADLRYRYNGSAFR
jgi:hypothetical protein